MAIDPKHYVIELEHPNGFTVSRLLLTSPCIIRDDFQCPFIEFMILKIILMNTRQITKLFFSQWLLFLITWHRSHLLVFFFCLLEIFIPLNFATKIMLKSTKDDQMTEMTNLFNAIWFNFTLWPLSLLYFLRFAFLKF